MTLAAALAAIEAVRRVFKGTPVPLTWSSGYRAGYNHGIEDAKIALEVLERGPTEGAA